MLRTPDSWSMFTLRFELLRIRPAIERGSIHFEVKLRVLEWLLLTLRRHNACIPCHTCTAVLTVFEVWDKTAWSTLRCSRSKGCHGQVAFMCGRSLPVIVRAELYVHVLHKGMQMKLKTSGVHIYVSRQRAEFDVGDGPAAAREAGRLAAIAATIALCRSLLLMMTLPNTKAVKQPQDTAHAYNKALSDFSYARPVLKRSYARPALRCEHLPSNGYVAKRLASLLARRGGNPVRVCHLLLPCMHRPYLPLVLSDYRPSSCHAGVRLLRERVATRRRDSCTS